jgi:deoxyribonuclease-4
MSAKMKATKAVKRATKKVASRPSKPVVKKPARTAARTALKKALLKKAPAKQSPAKRSAAKQSPATKPARAIVVSREPRATIPTPDPLGPLGAHVSTAGGVALAPPRADEIGATGMQIFTKTPNQWKEPTFDGTTVTAYQAALKASGQRWACSHDSYLINLASPDPTLRDRSLESFTQELKRCNALGLDVLVSHPGNFLDNRASGIMRNADAITHALEDAPGPTILCMELTAGQGTVLGSTFDEMASLLSRIPASLQSRLGVCLDTCHVFAAGYDLVKDYDGVWQKFGDIIGFARLGVIHLNDSVGLLGSHKDRHALIGEGALGDAVFRRLMTDPRLAQVPKMLETPKSDDLITNDRRMINKLRKFARAG